MHEKSTKETQTSLNEILRTDGVIELAKPSELVAFEDFIAAGINPEMSERQTNDWDCRLDIGGIIRPPKFNGRITNIRLEPMEDPLRRLLDANERGLRFVKGFVLSPLSHDENELQLLSQPYRGFSLTADALSTGKGTVGQIRTELWYGPSAPRKPGSSYSVEGRAANVNGGIRRYIARPEMHHKSFEDHHRSAIKSIGSAAVFSSKIAINHQSSKRFDSPRPISNTN